MSKLNKEIEYLRAFAIVLTLFGHGLERLFPWRPQGFPGVTDFGVFWGGVDLFFCISGYVVSASFVSAMDASRKEGTQWYAAKAFWVRRFFRLLPSAWFWILFVLACSIFVNSSTVFSTPMSNIKAAVSVATFTGNFAQRLGGGLGQNFVYWSLALEEQFYFIFPLFLVFVKAAWRTRVLLVLIMIQFGIDRSIGWASAFWPTRLDALMWGVLIHLFASTLKIFAPASPKPTTSALVTVLLLVLICAIPVHLQNLPVYVGILAVVCAIAVFLASAGVGAISPLLPKPLMLWFGSRSYALYLCHMPMIYLTHEIWFRHAKWAGLEKTNSTYSLRYFVTAVLLIGIAAELNYRLIEMPLRRKGAALAKQIMKDADDRAGARSQRV